MKAKFMSLAILSLVVFAVSSFAQTSPVKVFNGQKVGLSNFGQMDERFFRGERPGKNDFATLKAIGIDTVIDLTDNTPEEEGLAKAAGLKYINVPIRDKSYPTDETVAKFLAVVNDPATGKFYVHCAGGRHRTGDMGAVYRFQQGWDYDKVMQEMENYDFYTSGGHGKQKDFVVDYAQKATAERTKSAVSNAGTF